MNENLLDILRRVNQTSRTGCGVQLSVTLNVVIGLEFDANFPITRGTLQQAIEENVADHVSKIDIHCYDRMDVTELQLSAPNPLFLPWHIKDEFEILDCLDEKVSYIDTGDAAHDEDVAKGIVERMNAL